MKILSCILDHRIAPLRRVPERRSQRIPDQPRAIPPNSFPSRRLRTSCLCRQGIA